MRSRRGDSPAGQPRGNALLRPTDTSGAWVLSGRYAAAQCSVQRAALLVTTCAAGVAALICCPREKLALSAALSCLYACRSLGATYAQDDTDGDGTEHIGQ
jgi:hypothetical protein